MQSHSMSFHQGLMNFNWLLLLIVAAEAEIALAGPHLDLPLFTRTYDVNNCEAYIRVESEIQGSG